MSGIPTLLGVPWDASSSYRRGAAGAPARIREALHSPAGNRSTEALRELDLRDAGDVSFDAADPFARIEQEIARVLAQGGAPLVLGGDHSITWPVLRGMRPRHAPLSVLHVDAHPDLYDEFEGDRRSHACPFARIMEEGLAERLVQVGIRTMTRHQREQAERFGVEVIDMRAWHAGARPAPLRGPLYLSLDLDALDPAFAPGVSHPEPGGLATREVIALIQSLRGTLVGADIVECNPELDVHGSTARVAAKLVREVADAMLGMDDG